MNWDTLAEDLSARFPAIADEIATELEWWAPDSYGREPLLGDVFTPYVERLLRDPNVNDEEIARVFAAIEELVTGEDIGLRWDCTVSVLEGLEEDHDLLELAKQWMGPESRRRVPTREWIPKHLEDPEEKIPDDQWQKFMTDEG